MKLSKITGQHASLSGQHSRFGIATLAKARTWN